MFKIEITETITEEREVEGDWTIVHTEEELSVLRAGGENVSAYGYAPPRRKSVQSTRTVFMQEVQSVSIAEVIRAINGIS
jgi:hypothetical protein